MTLRNFPDVLGIYIQLYRVTSLMHGWESECSLDLAKGVREVVSSFRCFWKFFQVYGFLRSRKKLKLSRGVGVF